MMSASARSIAAHEATPQRVDAQPSDPDFATKCGIWQFHGHYRRRRPDGHRRILQARASDAALRDYLMWRRVGSPLVSDDGDSPRAKASSRSPSPTTVAFDLTHKLDGEDVLFALDVGSGTRSPTFPHFYLLVIQMLLPLPSTISNKPAS